MTDHASTIASAVARLNAGDVDGYIKSSLRSALSFPWLP